MSFYNKTTVGRNRDIRCGTRLLDSENRFDYCGATEEVGTPERRAVRSMNALVF